MWGYIVNFFKYATFPSSLKPEMREYLNSSRSPEQSGSLLVYGDYDRLSVERIDQFLRFRDVDHYALRWMGPRQSVLLYRLFAGVASSLPSGTEDLLGLFCQPRTAQGRSFQRNFLVFTMVTLDPRLHRSCDFGQVLESCCKLISTQVRSQYDSLIQPDRISYQVYGSFSSAELVIVWYVDQYVDALRLADMLRYTSFTVSTEATEARANSIIPFVSLYSIVAQDREGREDSAKWRSPQIEGYAELRFAFQDGLKDVEKFEQFLFNDLRELLRQENDGLRDSILGSGQRNVGIYDYSIRMPAFLLCDPGRNIFQRDKPLHWDNHNASQFFSLTYVQLYYDMPEGERPASVSQLCPELKPAVFHTEGSLRHRVERITKMVYGLEMSREKSLFASEAAAEDDSSEESSLESGEEMLAAYRTRGLRYVVKKLIPPTDGLCDSLDLLYSDFVNNCSNLTSSAWAEDLTTQFIAILDYIANQFYPLCEGQKTELFSDIKSICDIYIQMIYHIAQSRRTVFIVPSCHLRYMGQYDMILHAYYGWVKCLLDLACSLSHNNGIQHTLIPVLTIDVIPEICVRRYTVNHHFDESESITSIFSINLPLAAVTDFLRYSMVICHETAHLMISHDRDRRNQVIGMLFFSEFVANLALAEIELDLMHERYRSQKVWRYAQVLGPIKRGLMTLVYNGMRVYYVESLHRAVIDDLHGAEPNWETYRSELINRLGNLLEVNENVTPLITFLAKNQHSLQELISQCVTEAAPWSDEDKIFDAKELSDEIWNSVKEVLLNLASTNLQKLVTDYQTLLKLSGWQNMYSESSRISRAYREASQDLFMIRVFGLDVEDYLIFLDRHRHDSIQLGDDLPPMESLRISMVCDYLLTPVFPEREAPRNTAFILDEFDRRGPNYVDLFMRVPEMYGQVEKDPAACRSQIQEYFLAARERLVQYYSQYEFVRRLLLLQLRDADILYASEEFQSKAAQAKMDSSYTAWKSAVKRSASPGSPEELRIKHDVFRVQVELIQRFQTQETLKNLSLKLRECDSSNEQT